MDYTFTLSAAETHIVLRGLGKLLLEESLNTFAKINLQRDAQDKASNVVSLKQPPNEHSQSVRDAGTT